MNEVVVIMALLLAATSGALAVVDLRRRRTVESELSATEQRLHEVQTELGATTARLGELEAEAAAALQSANADGAHDHGLADPETGLPGAEFFAITALSRVAAARRHLRPVAIVLVEVLHPTEGGTVDAVLVASHLSATLREADTACRLEGDVIFGLVLEDTPENGAVWTVERFRRALAAEPGERILRAGIACYPAHAFDTDELRDRAAEALEAARQWRQDRIEVATSSDV